MIQLKELTTKQENAGAIPSNAIFIYHFSLEKYNTYLDDMIPNNYKQIAVFEGDVCVGLSDCGLEQNSGLASI
jgi:hypothetical protein